MMRQAKIFLDGGDADETKEALSVSRDVVGQTTNPSLIAKNPIVQARIAQGELFTKSEISDFYRDVVTKINEVLGGSSISIEVYADKDTTPEEMLEEARVKNTWVPNAYIKLPITKAGLAAARQAVDEGIKVNMTLCFSQEQAAAVHAATSGAPEGDVYVSPFIGRLDDVGSSGISLVENIVKMYDEGDKHVYVLAASIRTPSHVLRADAVGADLITVPLSVLKPLHRGGSVQAEETNVENITYSEPSLTDDWQSYNIQHDLTDKGLKRFADDWNSLLKV